MAGAPAHGEPRLLGQWRNAVGLFARRRRGRGRRPAGRRSAARCGRGAGSRRDSTTRTVTETGHGSSRSRNPIPRIPPCSGVSLHRLGEICCPPTAHTIQLSQGEPCRLHHHGACGPACSAASPWAPAPSRGSPPRAVPRKRPTAPRWTSRSCPSTTSTGTSSRPPAPAAASSSTTASTRRDAADGDRRHVRARLVPPGARRRRVPRHPPRAGAPGPPELADRRRRRPHRRLAAALRGVPRRALHRGAERARASTSPRSATTSSTRATKSCSGWPTAAASTTDRRREQPELLPDCTRSRARTSPTSRPTSSTRAPTRRSCRPTRSRTSSGAKIGFIGMTLKDTPIDRHRRRCRRAGVHRRGRDRQRARARAAQAGRQRHRRPASTRAGSRSARLGRT